MLSNSIFDNKANVQQCCEFNILYTKFHLIWHECEIWSKWLGCTSSFWHMG
jgi:hypothetical protein